MSKSADSRKALGKGLSALLPSRPATPAAAAPRTETPASEAAPAAKAPAGVQEVPIDQIERNPFQPRVTFRAEQLDELAQSIRANGIIQPLVVQRAGDKFQLVAGERRWRAAGIAGLASVPVVVREFASDRLLEVALIENIQREDLNPMEVAEALDRLATEHRLSHEEIGRRTGKDRSTVTNLIRLRKLPPDVQALVAEHKLAMGHARALLGLPTPELQRDMGHKAAEQGLSVRQLERSIQLMSAKRDAASEAPKANTAEGPDPNVAAAARELESALGTRVRILAQSADRGKIEIDYFSFDDLDRIYNLIVGRT